MYTLAEVAAAMVAVAEDATDMTESADAVKVKATAVAAATKIPKE
jgi:hypothetical protein